MIFLTGMLEEHKLLFSLHMAMEFEQRRGNLTQEEVDFFIKGSAGLTKSERASPAKWIHAQVSSQHFYLYANRTQRLGNNCTKIRHLTLVASSHVIFLRNILQHRCSKSVILKCFTIKFLPTCTVSSVYATCQLILTSYISLSFEYEVTYEEYYLQKRCHK